MNCHKLYIKIIQEPTIIIVADLVVIAEIPLPDIYTLYFNNVYPLRLILLFKEFDVRNQELVFLKTVIRILRIPKTIILLNFHTN